MKDRLLGLLEAVSFCAVYLVSSILGSMMTILVALGWTTFEFVSNRMSVQSDVFVERMTEILNSQMIVSILLTNMIVVLLCWIILWCRKQDLSEYVGFCVPRASGLVGAAVAGISLNFAVGCVLELLPIPTEMLQEYAEGMEELLGGPVIVVLLTAALAAPFVEEFLFRGALLRALRKAVGTPFAVLLSSLAFAFVHVGPIQITYAFVIGVILCIVRLASGSLWCSVAMHVAFNAANYILFDESLYGDPVFLCAVCAVFVVSCTLACFGKKHP